MLTSCCSVTPSPGSHLSLFLVLHSHSIAVPLFLFSPSASSETVAERLQQTSQMIANLYQQQLGRLRQLPCVGEEGSYIPQPPSGKELGTGLAICVLSPFNLNMPIHVHFPCSTSSCYGIGVINLSGIYTFTAMGKAVNSLPLCIQLQPQDVISLHAVRQAIGIAPFVPQPQGVNALKNIGSDE